MLEYFLLVPGELHGAWMYGGGYSPCSTNIYSQFCLCESWDELSIFTQHLYMESDTIDVICCSSIISTHKFHCFFFQVKKKILPPIIRLQFNARKWDSSCSFCCSFCYLNSPPPPFFFNAFAELVTRRHMLTCIMDRQYFSRLAGPFNSESKPSSGHLCLQTRSWKCCL